jgi:hypothetical protein
MLQASEEDLKKHQGGGKCSGACLVLLVNQAQFRRYQNRNSCLPDVPQVVAYRPIRLTTGVLLWPKPNSRPTNGFPSHNFTNGYPVCSGHGDRMGNGRTRAFTATQGGQVQSKES